MDDRPSEEISSFDRSSHFYERERDRRDGDAYLRRASSTYHVAAAEPLRGRTRDRHYRNGPYTPIIESVVSRQPAHHRGSWNYDTPSRYPQTPTTPDVYADDRRDLTPVVVVHKKHSKSRSGSNGSESGSASGSSVSRSRSSSSSSQSGSSSCSSASSSPASDKSSHHGSLRSGVTLQSAVSTPHTNNSSPAVHSDDRRPLAICVRNLPARSSDTSLKDGLFHEYKKHGKVTWVKVVGQGSDRYALVCFKKPDDVEKALQVSHDKLFFGCKIEVAPYQGYDVDDNEFRFVARPYEAEQDEFHPKATRTLFIGNLEKDITAPELRKHFDQFGEIIEIDIKKQGSNSSYAFCQYCDIGSVVRAMRTLDGEHLGNNRIKLGFGKSLHTNCVWVDGVAESVTEKYLSLQFSQFGPVSHVAIDRTRGHALVFYDQIAFAQSAVKEMRGAALRGRKLQVDFASRECQEAFYDHLEKQTGHNTTFENSAVQVSPQGVTSSTTRGFETPSSSSSSSGGGGVGGTSRYPRYSTQPSAPRAYSRITTTTTNTNHTATSPGASPARSTPRHVTTTPRFDFNPDYLPDRRPYRSYEEMALEDGGIVTVTVGQGPQDIRHLQKERVALLEQLEDCASSGEEGGSRRRCKHRRSHSGEGSRPGTPLCDERPENLPPVEPRRTPRERPPDPLSLPLPRFATQLMSPRPAPPSPPASPPPPRPQSTSSDDSEPSPPSPEWEERLRSLDEKYEKWSGSRTAMTKVDPAALRVRHKLLDLDLHELQPSDIVKSVLAKRSVFDEDSKRLENFGEKYEPREFVPTRQGLMTTRPRQDSPSLHSPVPPAAASSPAGAKGLQYPFPSHPPVQPTTSVATTTAPMSVASCSTISSGIASLSSNVSSVDCSKSPQAFPTSCISTVSSVRQFQTPSSTFPPPPKISPPPTMEKKDSIDPLLRVNCVEKFKSTQKFITSISSNTEKTDSAKKDAAAPPPLPKPLKSCLRRDSGDERRDIDGRRRSRDDELKVPIVPKIECDKGRESEGVERRRSLSDPRRRDSVDSNKDSLRSESAGDKIKDRNHKEERRRRDSVDNSAKKDADDVDTFKARLSDSRVSEHSDISECQHTDSSNVSFNTQPNDNLRHSQVTDTSEKKKDSIQICPERDRRRCRDSVDSSSDNSRHRKVPDSLLDVKKELESDTRQKDSSTDKNDSIVKKSVDYNDRRKDSGHFDSKNNEIYDRRKEKDNLTVPLENVRHKEKKDQTLLKKDKDGDFLENSRHKNLSRKSPEISDSTRHKDDKLKLTFPDNIKNREHSSRRESDSSDEHTQKSNDNKRDLEPSHQSSKTKDSVKKEHTYSESSCTNKLEESNENLGHKDLKRDMDPLVTVRHRENNKHDYSRLKENEKKKDYIPDLFHVEHCEIKKEKDADMQKYQDHNKEVENNRHLKQTPFDLPIQRLKDSERKKDGEKHDPRLKQSDRILHNDIFEISKQKNSVKPNNAETTNQISEWVEEIRKDLESSGYAKNRISENEFDNLVSEKKTDSFFARENYHNEKRKGDSDVKIKEEVKSEDDFDMLFKENDRNRFVGFSESWYYDGKKTCDTAEIFRRKDISRKKETNDLDGLKLKDIDIRRDNDFFENSKHKNLGERKRETTDHSRLKERDSDYVSDNNRQKDWLENTFLDKKSDVDKARASSKDQESMEKEYCEFDNRKENIENCQKLGDSLDHEEVVRKNDYIKKEKKKERLNSWPAAIGCKRRLSSQDSLDICTDDSKKSKPERRDSKDSGRSSSSSKRSNSEKHNKSFTKLLEEKIKEDKEKEMNKKRKEDELASDILKAAPRKEKRNSGEKRKEDRKGKLKHKENGMTASESEAGSGEDGSKTPKRHSIFDIVDEEPAYISMYDKVKARSTKNMQKQEEEKRQEMLKEKFNQLKQSRAKREEKKRSTSYDEDSDSERGGRRSNKLMITSSEEDAGSESDMRSKGRKIMSDTSEDDSHRQSNPTCLKPIRSTLEENESKPRKIMSETSEDDTPRLSIARIKVARAHQEDLELKQSKILSDTSEDDIRKHSMPRNKPSRIQSDESELDLGYEEQKKEDGFVKKTNDYATSDLFSNISEDPEHLTHTDIEREHTEQYHRNSIDSSTSDLPRKKSHKKKQKRQKNPEDPEDGTSKRHSSKKDRRKSSHSHDGDEDQLAQTKVRRKKSERDSTSKRDDKMEDIFGPMSDDSDKIHNKWNASQIYGSDTDEERQQVVRKRDKRRKERKARELDEAGRALEAQLMDNPESFPTSEEVTKSKKKKRKKSREEKVSKHHQQRLDEEATARANEADSEREPEPTITPPSLPRLIDSPPPSVSQNKKPDIPGFGSQVDENIHETAVKSISESSTKPIEEKREPIEDAIPTTNAEDKPTPVISQEETEDAVAALLLEDSFSDTKEPPWGYNTKPDTPVSEPDLQIDTDTEDTFDPIDFSRPPRTPDIPTSWRQQDTREGLEERISALACPDNGSSKNVSGTSPGSSPNSTMTSEYNPNDREKSDKRSKPENDAAIANTSSNKDVPEITKKQGYESNNEHREKPVVVVEATKRHDLPPLVCQGEISHVVQPMKVNYPEVKPKIPQEQSFSKSPGPKIVATDKPTFSTNPAMQIKTVASPIPPPLIQTTNQMPKSLPVPDVSPPVSLCTSSPQAEVVRKVHTVQSQINQPTVFSTQHEMHRNKITYSQPSAQELVSDKPLTSKPVSQIIVTPPTSVALIVQTQSKQAPSSQQNNSVLQLSTKIHSPVNQQVEIKGNAQMSQYVLHHNMQSSQILGSQQTPNRLSPQSKLLNQSIPSQVSQGNHKLSVPHMPVSSKSPIQGSLQEHKYKQIVLNSPHSQQLTVNVSHNHQINANLLMSPPGHSPAALHSPAAMSFSPHQIKVSLGPQSNNMHQNSVQLSPNVHHQQISPLGNHQQKHMQQHSPAIQQHSPVIQQHSPAIQHHSSVNQHISLNHQQNKNTSLLQQVPNCISSIPVKLCSPTKPGATIQTVRHLSPVSQPNAMSKMNAHMLPTGLQQVRAVVLQNPAKQTLTLLQPQMVSRPGVQMIRPINAPQPQVVHTLKNDPPVLDKSKFQPDMIQSGHSTKTDIPASSVASSKSFEEPLSLTASKKEEEKQHPCKADQQAGPENKSEQPKPVHLENKPFVKTSVDDVKPLNAVIQDLTFKATQAKQASCLKSNQVEDVKSTMSKPLDQVVQEIHDRRKAAEPKEDLKCEVKTQPLNYESNVTSETVIQDKQEISPIDVKPENSMAVVDDTSEVKVETKDVTSELKDNKSETTGNENIKPVLVGEEVKDETDNSSKSTKDNVIDKQVEEPKVEKIRIKKEETGLCIDPLPASISSSKTEKSASDSQNVIKEEHTEEDIKTSSDSTGQTGEVVDAKEEEQVVVREITASRGRGGRRRKATGRVGGVVTRRARRDNSTAAANDTSNDAINNDVYEFRDDSEEEANRPRLILTIKSPHDPAPPPPPVQAPAQTNNSASTRKSRRLQEKDGSRNTVDDTIEDVIRGTRSGRRTTRATANCPTTIAPALETRKSPRRKHSATVSVPSVSEPPQTPEPTLEPDIPQPPAPTSTPQATVPSPPTPPQPQPETQPPPPTSTASPSTEPMTLIDPVTGLLIPMQESEEGQYIPVNSDHVRPPLESKEESGEPLEKRLRTSLPTEAETTLPTRAGIPVKVPPNCAVVPPLPPKPSVPSEVTRPIIHGKTTGIVVPSGIPRPTSGLASPLALNKPLTITAPSLVKPQGVMMSPTGVTKTNVVGPMTINRVVATPTLSPSAKPVGPSLSPSTPLTHKTHLLQAVTGSHRSKVPTAKVPTPLTPKAHILHSMSNVVAREGMVGPGTPPPHHHGTLLTGSVASPPLRAPHHASQQPVVTGASSARVVCKTGGLVDPVKVEPGGCIVVPTASPQPRTQVMQAGLPVLAYEASIGEVVQHVSYPPHHLQPAPAHYVHPQLVYQQYLREAAITGYHLPPAAPGGAKSVKSELEEAAGVSGSPPLELRRGSPHDRATDSPQVATVYVHGPRPPPHHLYYEPPPAHRPAQPRHLPATPPHASQVPPQADSLLMLLQRYPVMWQGLLALKTDQAAVQMHFVFGNPNVARDSLPCNSDGSTPPLRIAQRMRLEQTQVEGVARKMQMDNEHCMLLALPCGCDHMDVLQQSNNLRSGFITYLQQKQAAGIVNIAAPGSQQAAYVVHIFPSCDFANESLARIAPDLLHRVANIAHLLIVIATV